MKKMVVIFGSIAFGGLQACGCFGSTDTAGQEPGIAVVNPLGGGGSLSPKSRATALAAYNHAAKKRVEADAPAGKRRSKVGDLLPSVEALGSASAAADSISGDVAASPAVSAPAPAGGLKGWPKLPNPASTTSPWAPNPLFKRGGARGASLPQAPLYSTPAEAPAASGSSVDAGTRVLNPLHPANAVVEAAPAPRPAAAPVQEDAAPVLPPVAAGSLPSAHSCEPQDPESAGAASSRTAGSDPRPQLLSCGTESSEGCAVGGAEEDSTDSEEERVVDGSLASSRPARSGTGSTSGLSTEGYHSVVGFKPEAFAFGTAAAVTLATAAWWAEQSRKYNEACKKDIRDGKAVMLFKSFLLKQLRSMPKTQWAKYVVASVAASIAFAYGYDALCPQAKAAA